MSEKSYEEMDELEREIYDSARQYEQEHGDKVNFNEEEMERMADAYQQMSVNFSDIQEKEKDSVDVDEFIDLQRKNWLPDKADKK